MKKKKKRKKLHPVMRAAQIMDMPMDTDGTVAKVTLLGHRKALVENHRGVYACTEEGIILTGAEGMLAVHGRELEIKELDRERMLVEGYITGVSYE